MLRMWSKMHSLRNTCYKGKFEDEIWHLMAFRSGSLNDFEFLLGGVLVLPRKDACGFIDDLSLHGKLHRGYPHRLADLSQTILLILLNKHFACLNLPAHHQYIHSSIRSIARVLLTQTGQYCQQVVLWYEDRVFPKLARCSSPELASPLSRQQCQLCGLTWACFEHS